MMVCEECGHRAERALKLTLGDTVRIVCPNCKSPGMYIEMSDRVELYGQKYRFTVEALDKEEE